MKYMGSKQTMLLNGLGETILEQARGRNRIVDLFCGSGAVAWFAAEHTQLPVLAVDLQHYSVTLADAVLARTKPASATDLAERWLAPVRRSRPQMRLWKRWQALRVAERGRLRKADVIAARRLCGEEQGGLVWRSFGGYYLSPGQAVSFDLMLRQLPDKESERTLCLAALIATASRCAAAPGHTAQPFRPSKGALPFIESAWRKDPLQESVEFIEAFAGRHARVRGRAHVGDAVSEAKRLGSTDLVVLDPPYSAVQYSRFYHVLETLARGQVSGVEGAGRYPPFHERPRSDFSVKTRAHAAFAELFRSLATAGCTVVLTFPASSASNGLSGGQVKALAESYFKVLSTEVAMRFSTLGGNNAHRPSRHDTEELIVTMQPQ